MSGEELYHINQAIASNWVAPAGPCLSQFESSLNQVVKSSYSVALSSGTAALHLALILLGVSQGDEVLCSTFTFTASANPILYLKARPILWIVKWKAGICALKH